MQNEELVKFAQDEFSKVVASSYYQKKSNDDDSFVENALIQPNKVTRALYHCSPTTFKMFCFLLTEYQMTKATRNGDRWISLDLTNERYQINKGIKGKKNKEYMKKALDDVLDLYIFIETESRYYRVNIFEAGDFSKEKNALQTDWKSLKFKFSEEFTKILEIEEKGNFTILSLDNIKDLDSFYALRYYGIGMSWKGLKGCVNKTYLETDWAKEHIKDPRNTWLFGYSISQLRIMFDLKDKYSLTNNFIKRVVDEPLQILNKTFPDYEFQYEIKRGAKNSVAGIIFWLTDKNPPKLKLTKKTIEKAEVSKTIESTISFSNEDELNDYCSSLMEKFGAVWDACYDEAKRRGESKGLSDSQINFLAVEIMHDCGCKL